ncbi:MAG: ABC transporter ATP-binding protein/permease [Clostridia bacterium]|nr:ABC transporter ATP-binding protein/permease [Clostridia bacterium]
MAGSGNNRRFTGSRRAQAAAEQGRNHEVRKGTGGRLLRYIWERNKLRLTVVFFGIIVSAVASTIATFFLQQLIDDCIVPGIELGMDAVWGKLMRMLTIMGCIYILGTLGFFAYTRIMASVTQGTLKKLRDDMFDKMQTLPVRFFDTNAHGDIMSTYTNDTDAIRMLIGQSIPSLFQASLSVLAVLCMMLYYSIWLTIIVAVFCVLMIFVTRKLGGISARYMIRQQQSLASEEGFVEEMISGLRVVKVFNHEEENREKFKELNEALFHDGSVANRYGNILMPVLGNLGNLLYVVIAVVGGLMVFGGVNNIGFSGMGLVTAGMIISFLSMARNLSQTIGQVSMQVPMIAMGIAGADRIFRLMDREPEEDQGHITLVRCERDAEGNIVETDRHTEMWAWKDDQKLTEDGKPTYTVLAGDVRLKDVTFGYTPEKTVIHGVSLFAKPGQKIAFVGATGAGKTTITNLINRFYDIGEGTITYDGIDVKDIKKPDLRRSMGVVLQDVNLFTGTVMENIRYGNLEATDEECIAAAKLANAHGFITRLSNGYDTVLTGNGSELSQGQRQLLSIARAAVADPPVMVLDEATSSIDTRTESLVQAGMDNLMKGRTVFVIAHRLSTVRNSNAIMVMDHGRIIERGDHDELLAQKGTYYQLYTGAFELD